MLVQSMYVESARRREGWLRESSRRNASFFIFILIFFIIYFITGCFASVMHS